MLVIMYMDCSTSVKLRFLVYKMGRIIQDSLFKVVLRLEIMYTTYIIWGNVSFLNKGEEWPA